MIVRWPILSILVVLFSYANTAVHRDAHLNMAQTLDKYGYPHQIYHVKTEDGFILKLYRIQKCSSKKLYPLVLMHGLLNNSFDWFVLGVGKALGYLAADQCYDTWVANSRGNFESRNHTHLDPKDPDFWKFSFHEVGYYDLPAIFDFVIMKTGKKRLNYVGYSQGTTSFFVYSSLFPKHAERIVRQMHALAPVAYLNHTNNVFIKAIARNIDLNVHLIRRLNRHEIGTKSEMSAKLGPVACASATTFSSMCAAMSFLASGVDPKQYNTTIYSLSAASNPSGSSAQSFIHYGQLVRLNRFQQYDHHHGKINNNWVIYGHPTPPEYPVEHIEVPLYFYYGNNDPMGNPTDVKQLAKRIQKVVVNEVPYDKFTHLDFIYGNNAKDLVNDLVLENLMKD